MPLGKKLVLATTCVLGLSGGGEAAELFTPFLIMSPGNTFLACVVSNVSNRDTTVRIEALSFSGVSLNDSGESVLPAGETSTLNAPDSARCKFTVQTKNDVRAHVTVYQTGIGSTSSAEAN